MSPTTNPSSADLNWGVHYPRGWGQTSNTPFRFYKGQSFAGGIRVPFLLSWPAGLKPGADDNGIRDQFAYVTDLTPTLLELAGIDAPSVRNGLPVKEFDGGVFRVRSAFVCRSEHSHRAVHRDDRQPWLLQGRLETAGSHPGGHRQTALAVVRRPHRPDRARRPGITVSRQGSRTRRGLGPLGVGEHRVSSTRQYRRRGSPSGGRSTLTPGATTCRNAPRWSATAHPS